MTLYAIDPGTEQSALVHVEGKVCGSIWPNQTLLGYLRHNMGSTAWPGILIIEKIEAMGMAVGRETFDTVCWAGRFCEAWQSNGFQVQWMTRRTVKLHLCGSMRAKDANIRQALLDRYGGKAATKKGGPLYGISSHMWSALALAVTWQEQQQ